MDGIGEPMARSQRIRLLRDRVAEPGRGAPVLLGGRYVHLPVARVPIDALVYRADNGRLAADLAATPLPGPADSAQVQALLHGLLEAKAADPRGPIRDELRRLAMQTEPLITLFDGTVVNGNRRLAAMRSLLAADPARYAGFRAVDVVVLPEDTAPADVEYLEAALQMAPETKLGYGWIDRRLKLRRQRDVLRLPPAAIRDAYRIDDLAQIDREIDELSLAEDYLREFRGESGAYRSVADAGGLFEGLRAQLARLPVGQRGFWRLAGFAMIDGREPVLQRRLEQLFPFAPPPAAELPERVRRRLGERLTVAQGADAGEAATGPRADPLAIMGDRGRSRQTARLIADLVDEVRLELSESAAPERLLQKVREAGRLISRLEPERLTAAQRRRLGVELAALSAHGRYLLEERARRPSVPGVWKYAKPVIRPPYWKIPWRLLKRLGWAGTAGGGR